MFATQDGYGYHDKYIVLDDDGNHDYYVVYIQGHKYYVKKPSEQSLQKWRGQIHASITPCLPTNPAPMVVGCNIHGCAMSSLSPRFTVFHGVVCISHCLYILCRPCTVNMPV